LPHAFANLMDTINEKMPWTR